MANLITQQQLAERWQMSIGTLTNWRVKKIGPKFVKLGEGRGCKVMYRPEDIEAFEELHLVKDLKW